MTATQIEKIVEAIMKGICPSDYSYNNPSGYSELSNKIRTALEQLELEEEQDDDYDEIIEPTFDFANSEIIQKGKENISGFEYDVTVRKDVNETVLYSIERNFTLHAIPLDQFPKTDQNYTNEIKVINPDDMFPGSTKL